MPVRGWACARSLTHRRPLILVVSRAQQISDNSVGIPKTFLAWIQFGIARVGVLL